MDGRLRIATPDGEAADFLVEVKRVLNRRDIGVVARRLGDATDDNPAQCLVMARYISPPLQELPRERSLSYIDATGNMMVTARRPAMVLRDRGASQDPFPGPGRPRATLKGEPAARLIRTLARESGPWSARELVARSGVSTGATYRVLELLQEEELVSRTAGKRFEVTDWPQLLRRWSRDYSFVDNTQTYQFIDPRGVPALLKKLAKEKDPGFRYAVTGSVAAAGTIAVPRKPQFLGRGRSTAQSPLRSITTLCGSTIRPRSTNWQYAGRSPAPVSPPPHRTYGNASSNGPRPPATRLPGVSNQIGRGRRDVTANPTPIQRFPRRELS